MVAGALLALLSMIIYIFITSGEPDVEDVSPKKEYRRIISMAPNITETVFALDLQNKLVGVTNFCTYPPEAVKIAKVGGYLNPNYEALLALKPDLVILLPEQANVRQYLTELNIPSLEVDNKTVNDILKSILTIGRTCGAAGKADSLAADIRQRIAAVQRRVKGLPKYSVLISVGRTVGSGNLADVYAAGKGTYYDELINYAGGINAIDNSLTAYPVLSAEGIIRLNPDVIIDIVLQSSRGSLSDSEIEKDWQPAQKVKAIQKGRFYVFSNEYAVIPGPRFINLLEDLSFAIHPENNDR